MTAAMVTTAVMPTTVVTTAVVTATAVAAMRHRIRGSASAAATAVT